MFLAEQPSNLCTLTGLKMSKDTILETQASFTTQNIQSSRNYFSKLTWILLLLKANISSSVLLKTSK